MKENRFVTFHHEPTQWLNPVQLSSGSLLRLSTQPTTLRSVISTLKLLNPDDYLEFMLDYYEEGLKKFDNCWDYADLLTVLQAAATVLKPQNYLEIGVRRGRSLGIVAAAFPPVHLVGFDLWISNYSGMENPGKDFVRSEIGRLQHTGELTLISGDSKETVPRFLRENPDFFFDLITVDGDHSAEGAATDLQNVLPRLKIGGVIVLDDIAHPQHSYLAKVWARYVGDVGSFDSCMYSALGYGIAFAIRKGP